MADNAENQDERPIVVSDFIDFVAPYVKWLIIAAALGGICGAVYSLLSPSSSIDVRINATENQVTPAGVRQVNSHLSNLFRGPEIVEYFSNRLSLELTENIEDSATLDNLAEEIWRGIRPQPGESHLSLAITSYIESNFPFFSENRLRPFIDSFYIHPTLESPSHWRLRVISRSTDKLSVIADSVIKALHETIEYSNHKSIIAMEASVEASIETPRALVRSLVLGWSELLNSHKGQEFERLLSEFESEKQRTLLKSFDNGQHMSESQRLTPNHDANQAGISMSPSLDRFVVMVEALAYEEAIQTAKQALASALVEKARVSQDSQANSIPNFELSEASSSILLSGKHLGERYLPRHLSYALAGAFMFLGVFVVASFVARIFQITLRREVPR